MNQRSCLYHQIMEKVKGLIKEAPYRRDWLKSMAETKEGRKFLAMSVAALQIHLRGRAKLQKSLGEQKGKCAEYRKMLSAWRLTTFDGRTPVKADMIAYAKSKVVKSQKMLNLDLENFSLLFLDTKKNRRPTRATSRPSSVSMTSSSHMRLSTTISSSPTSLN
jgi:hypothetical protein